MIKIIRKSLLIGTVFSCVLISSCKKENEEPVVGSLDEQLETLLLEIDQMGKHAFVLPQSGELALIPQDNKNPLTPAKVSLGRLLYHETAMAIKPQNSVSIGTYSCASCHSALAGFQSGVRQGIGDGGVGYGGSGEIRQRHALYTADQVDIQPLKSPSAMNTAYQELMLWNGQFGATGANIGTEHRWNGGGPLSVNNLGYEGLETQAIAGFGVHRMGVDLAVLAVEPYKSLFEQAFPGMSETSLYSTQTIGLAIAAYERTLLSDKAPFQNWLRDNNQAMSDEQKEGAILFFGKAECNTCHTGPALSSMEFYALGFNDLLGADVMGYSPEDKAHLGRGGYTGVAADNYKFKVPQLYNIRDARFYGHGATFNSVEEVIRYKNAGVADNTTVPNDQLSHAFHPLNLTEREIAALTDFVENALYDPDLTRYEPLSLPSGLCFPNNDSLSRVHRGCN